MKKLILVALAAAATCLTPKAWALSSSDVGRVIAADGKLYKTVAAAEAAGTTASGVVAYWSVTGGVEAINSAYRGLAISLADVANYIAWCADPSSWFAGSTLSQALDSRNGWERTDSFGRQGSRDVVDIYGHHHVHAAAAAAYDYGVRRPTGASPWFIPTMGQWNLAAKGLTGSSTDISETDNQDYTYSNLSAKLTAAGASGLNWAVYWSSTEMDGTNMWTFDIGGIGSGRNGGRALSVSKNLAAAEFVRAFFAFESATLAEYTVSYDANGGSGAPVAQTKDGGIDLSLSSTVPTRVGMVFAGWNTAANGNGTSYAAGATFTLNADTTLYAQWMDAYEAWAAENGITGEWDETSDGIHNVFRYVFGQPTGAFTNPPLIDIAIDGGNAVVITPPVSNTVGFTISVVESSDVAGAAVTRRKPLDATGRTVFPMGSVASRFYRLSATEGDAESDLGGVQLWENGPYWAECNVGASAPEEYGYYFWWGDTVGYTNTGSAWISVKDGTEIKFSSSDSTAASTYGKTNSELQDAGDIDATGNLVASHDAAHVHWGGAWRMPTADEIDALTNNCTSTWTTTNGVYGRLVTGKGDYANKSIFLPATGVGNGSSLAQAGSYGYGNYWSSTPDSRWSCSYAWDLHFYYNESSKVSRDYYSRSSGQPVRPVRDAD